MKTLLKVALGLVATAVVLFVALLIAVTFILEPNDYRPYIVDAVEQATGRPFELEGDLGLNLLPCCSMSLGPSRLGSPAGFPEPDFARLASASLSIRIWPLVTRREVEVGTVTLDGLDLTLTRLADGTVNWEFAEEGAEAEPGSAEASAPIDLKVDRVVLRDGRVRYRDQQAGQDYTVGELELDTRLAMAGERVDVVDPRLSLVASGPDLPGEVAVSVSAGNVTAVLAEQTQVSIDTFTVDARTLDMHVRLSGGGNAGAELALEGDFALAETSPRPLLAALSGEPYLPVDPAALQRLAAQGRWAFAGNRLAVESLSVALDDSVLSGTAAVEDLDSGAVGFDLTLDRIELDRYLAPPGATAVNPAAADSGGPTEIPLAMLADLPVDGTLRVGTLRASGVDVNDLMLSLTSRAGNLTTRLEAGLLGGTLSLAGSGDVATDTPRLTGNVKLAGLQPRTLLTALGTALDTAEPAVLRRLDGSADWQLTPRAAALTNLRWTLDDTTVTGSARVDDFDRLPLRFDLAVDRINLDAYLPPQSEEAPGDDSETDLIPVDVLRGLTLSGRLRATELVILEATLRDVLAEVSAADGIVRLDPLSAALYGGTYQGSLTIDATGARPNLTLDQKLAAVQINELLGRFFDSNLLAGSLSLAVSGSASGNTTSDLLRGLAANVSFDLSDGVYRGMNLLYQVQRARALVKNESPPAPPDKLETPIRALRASGRMVDGVLQTNQLTAKTDALRLLGKGGINLMALALDYELNAEVLSAAAAAARLGDLANITIPLTINGPLTAPRVGVDLQGLVTNAARDAVQNKAREALLKRLGGGASAGDAAAGGTGDGAAQAAPGSAGDTTTPPTRDPEPSTRDRLKRGLLDLIKPKPEDPAPQEQRPDGAS